MKEKDFKQLSVDYFYNLMLRDEETYNALAIESRKTFPNKKRQIEIFNEFRNRFIEPKVSNEDFEKNEFKYLKKSLKLLNAYGNQNKNRTFVPMAIGAYGLMGALGVAIAFPASAIAVSAFTAAPIIGATGLGIALGRKVLHAIRYPKHKLDEARLPTSNDRSFFNKIESIVYKEHSKNKHDIKDQYELREILRKTADYNSFNEIIEQKQNKHKNEQFTEKVVNNEEVKPKPLFSKIKQNLARINQDLEHNLNEIEKDDISKEDLERIKQNLTRLERINQVLENTKEFQNIESNDSINNEKLNKRRQR